MKRLMTIPLLNHSSFKRQSCIGKMIWNSILIMTSNVLKVLAYLYNVMCAFVYTRLFTTNETLCTSAVTLVCKPKWSVMHLSTHGHTWSLIGWS